MMRTLLAIGMAHLAAAEAGEPPRPVDAELLEFLGSIDTEEEGWQEFLAQKPVKRAASPGKTAPSAPPPKPETEPEQRK